MISLSNIEIKAAAESFGLFEELIPHDWNSSPEVQEARDSFKEFIFQAWHIVEPNTPLAWNWHLDEFCSLLQWLYEEKEAGRSHRVVVNVPPRYCKVNNFFCVI